ncbi:MULTISPECIES: arsenite methyltransferase [Methanothrix]|jgi:SAM-dependent methyltransferase|uniref:Arsenite methyltransferase n=1 Tax=hydrocarbon metagenome TaxID=938273 RepID=A0A0W8F9Z8_9ZZZZ|nr:MULTISPECIES: arsenite methyltransferase [Methanothrix]MDD4460675.1 arsenite methyltransferase [Proteiniphilum sp.]OPX82260.1 MAG: arsenite S-adenosylmethyltransferase [Methanosaeta sp. PtaB.Bin005]MDD3551647.1 arsenite methyltransferase [Methanothrix soehngenii]MDY0411479.1 arsenite methyltransferase [Methanothrix soehngenii]UEC41222.1 MAG: Arsenite methyltransferase [Methanothrix sp.]
MNDSEIKVLVKESYGKIARTGGSCCPTKGSCCGTLPPEEISKNIGYSEEEMNAVPQGANLGLGCGNPIALASIKEGETVLDLGSGAGFDSFLAANRVGPTGKVIGVDMTPEMINRARENADKGSYSNVQFVPGELEDLPVDDNSMDAVISNCVINLVPDKKKVFKEVFRVLKPGGRLMVSDLVLRQKLPLSIENSIEGYVGCISGAVMKDVYLDAIGSAGFGDVEVIEESPFSLDFFVSDSTDQAIDQSPKMSAEEVNGFADSVSSIKVRAIKPR